MRDENENPDQASNEAPLSAKALAEKKRAERVAQALRDNLRRRKAAQRKTKQ